MIILDSLITDNPAQLKIYATIHNESDFPEYIIGNIPRLTALKPIIENSRGDLMKGNLVTCGNWESDRLPESF